MPLLTSAAEALRALADLVLPVACVGCGRADEQVCRECASDLEACLWRGGPVAVRPDPCPPTLPVVCAAGRYEGALAKLVSGYKDRGRRDCAPALAGLLGRAVDATVALSDAALDTLRGANGPLLVVPVPSSAAARRSRGDAPLVRLAELAVRDASRRELVPADALAQRRRVADQAGLGARARAVNLEHSMLVRREWETAVAGATCVVVDDVLTTGATLVEAARALRSAGAAAVVAATICATQRRSAAPSGRTGDLG